MPEAHDANPIRVLRGLDAVRLRPAMYVGDTVDGSGLHRLVELAVLDALARRPARVVAALGDDGTVEVADDGAPFPAPAEAMLTRLMHYEPGQLALVNALSSRLMLRLWRDGGEERLAFDYGRVSGRPAALPARVAADATALAHPSAVVTFLAAREVFGTVACDRARIAGQLRDLGRREPGATLTLV